MADETTLKKMPIVNAVEIVQRQVDANGGKARSARVAQE